MPPGSAVALLSPEYSASTVASVPSAAPRVDASTVGSSGEGGAGGWLGGCSCRVRSGSSAPHVRLMVERCWQHSSSRSSSTAHLLSGCAASCSLLSSSMARRTAAGLSSTAATKEAPARSHRRASRRNGPVPTSRQRRPRATRPIASAYAPQRTVSVAIEAWLPTEYATFLSCTPQPHRGTSFRCHRVSSGGEFRFVGRML